MKRGILSRITIRVNENLLYHLASIVILMNILQLGLRMFGIGFNAAIVEYALLAFMVVAFGNRLRNWYNLIALLASALILLLSLLILENDTLVFYIREFIVYAAPLLIVFIFKIDYEKFLKILFRYAIFGILLYIANILLKTPLSQDYMTFGYGGIFCSLFVFIYSVVKKIKFGIVFGIICCVVFVIYGPRGGIIVVSGALLLLVLLSNKLKLKWKIATIVSLVILTLSMDAILDASLNFMNTNLGADFYIVRQFNDMQNASDAKGVLAGRYSIYENAILEISNNPFFGIGIGTFQNKYGYFAHNIFLDVYSTFGVIIGTFYFIVLFTIIYKSTKGCKNSAPKIMIIFGISISLRLLLSKTFVYDPYLWLLIASSLNIIQQSKSRKLVGMKKQIGIEEKTA